MAYITRVFFSFLAIWEPLDIVSGVPQSSIFSPPLVMLYINDMPSCICLSQALLYADDTVLILPQKLLSS